jgi:SSS family solute:Na+ symporter
MKMNTISAIIISLYLLIIVGIIVYTGRKNKNFKDYALGGGKLPWYILSASMMAAAIGGGVLIGYVGYFYTYGMQWLWIYPTMFAAALVMTFYFSPRIRRLDLYTMADIFDVRYGKNAKMVSAVINMLAGTLICFAMLSSFTTVLTGYIGLSENAAMIISVILFAVLASLGGLTGVAWSDAVQLIIILGGTITVGIVSFFKAGGFSGLSTLPSNLLSMTSVNIPLLSFVGTIISVVGVSVADQSVLFQKINATRSPGDAKKALKMYIVGQIVLIFAIVFMGLSSRVILGGDITNPNNVITELLKTLNPWLGTIYASAIASAVLTTANSMYLSVSMTFAKDIVKTFRPDMSDKSMLNVSRICVWVIAAISFFVVKYQSSIMGFITLVYICITCFVIPLYGGLLCKKATPASGFWSLLLSIASVFVWLLLGIPFGANPVYIALIMGTIGFVGGFANKKGVTQEQIDLVTKFKTKPQLKSDVSMTYRPDV